LNHSTTSPRPGRSVPSGIGIALLCAVLAILGPSAGYSALVRTDLIGGLGEFEFAGNTDWQQAQTGPWTYGVVASSPDDEVGPSWTRLCGTGVTPRDQGVFRIIRGRGYGGSNCQFVGLRGVTSGTKYVILQKTLRIRDTAAHEVHHGDELTFRIDHLFMEGYDTLPPGTTVTYKIGIQFDSPDGVNRSVLATIPATSQPISAEVTARVASVVTIAQLVVRVEVKGNSGTGVPGAFVDKAHLYVKRSGATSQATEEAPVPRNRSIMTYASFYTAGMDDPYVTASSFDAVHLKDESGYPEALRLKYYNPDIEVYLYEMAAYTIDWRSDTTLQDTIYSNCPFRFSWLLSTIDPLSGKPYADRFMYPLPPGTVMPPPGDLRIPSLKVNYVFSNDRGSGVQKAYFARLADTEYQRLWAANSVAKATAYGLDGIWMDEPSSKTATDSAGRILLEVKKSDVQAFLHYVNPVVRAANLRHVQNYCSINIDSAGAAAAFDPFFVPDSRHPAPAYTPNSHENTADVYYQEWAFWKHWPVNNTDQNQYLLDYWLACLSDMDKVALWNNNLPPGSARKIIMNFYGVNRTADPAAGQDGWIRFGVCSYLLACNGHCYLEGKYVETLANIRADLGLEVVRGLGEPTGSRQSLNSDSSLQSRDFEHGIVVVNAHSTGTKSWKAPLDLVTETGTSIRSGTSISLKPHSGRIFFKNAAIEVGIAVPSEMVMSGQVVDVTVTYENVGVLTGRSVVVQTQVPAQMEYVAGSAEATGGTWNPATGTLSWSVGDVAPRAKGTRLFRARVR